MLLIVLPDHQYFRCTISNFSSQPTAGLQQMDSSLHEVWTAAQGSPFVPAVGKDSQFFVGFGLLILGLFVAGVFTLSRSFLQPNGLSFAHQPQTDPSATSPSSEFRRRWPSRKSTRPRSTTPTVYRVQI